jgi:hypothetical protein
VGASQITAAEPLSLHRWISRSRPPNSAAAHAHPCARRLTNVPFCRPRDLLIQFIARKLRHGSGTSEYRIRSISYTTTRVPVSRP